MEKYTFDGKILIVGFGSIGQGVLPLILRHFSIPSERVTIVTGDSRGENVARELGVRFIIHPLLPGNYEEVVRSYIGAGDFLVNVSVDVSSAALIEHCQRNNILYIDTVMEPWLGFYVDSSLSVSQRSNYALREKALNLRSLMLEGSRPTAVLAHGANPGLVSHFVKQALLNIAKDTGIQTEMPTTREAWARLAKDLGVKVIHIAERDTQESPAPKSIGEFVNTWSIDGFAAEGSQPAATRVRSWTPTSKAQYGWIITHHESISISDYLTLKEGNKVIYRPTVHYAYHPCDGAVLSLDELAASNGVQQKVQRLISEDILSDGVDELGVLLMGHAKGAYWYGSRLSIDAARKLVPHNNATALQVTASMIGAMVWAMENPIAGIVDADEIDHETVVNVARPYLGEVFGEYTDWTPIQGRGKLFPEHFDAVDPWQFENFRVS